MRSRGHKAFQTDREVMFLDNSLSVIAFHREGARTTRVSAATVHEPGTPVAAFCLDTCSLLAPDGLCRKDRANWRGRSQGRVSMTVLFAVEVRYNDRSAVSGLAGGTALV